MDHSLLFFIGLLVVLIGIATIIKLCIWIAKFSLQIEYLKMEIKRSMDPQERERWKRELSALRWSVLPFMNRRRYYKLYRRFHKEK